MILQNFLHYSCCSFLQWAYTTSIDYKVRVKAAIVKIVFDKGKW